MDDDNRDIRQVIEDRIRWLDDKIEDYPAEGKEVIMLTGSISKLAEAYNKVETVRLSAEDNEAKREETKRMNDAEIEFKEAQLENEAKRLEAESCDRMKKLKVDLLSVIANAALNATAQVGYFGMATRTANHEYRLTDGNSLTPPRDVLNANAKLEKFIKK